MVTFSDMVTLLLTFFVLIVAMSEVEIKRFKEVISYFQGAESVMEQPLNVPDPSVNSKRDEKRKEKGQRLLTPVSEEIDGKIEMNRTEKGVHVVINDSLMFDPGQAVLKEEARPVLEILASRVTPNVQTIVVEGHTDAQPIATAQYPSNWELSGARATAVVRFMSRISDNIEPHRFVAMGYGAFQPVASNETPGGRAKNRRVEILFSRDKWQTKNQTPISKRLL